jgi:hypothetical protein
VKGGGARVRLERDDAGQRRLVLSATELAALGPGVDRILVVEEHHLAHDPAVTAGPTHSARIIYAEAVDGLQPRESDGQELRTVVDRASSTASCQSAR